eukprot:1079273-Pyramimonas_sp.AAC.1
MIFESGAGNLPWWRAELDEPRRAGRVLVLGGPPPTNMWDCRRRRRTACSCYAHGMFAARATGPRRATTIRRPKNPRGTSQN